MAKISILEFELDREDDKKLLSNLRVISYIHSNNEHGIVFVDAPARLSFGQYPYDVKKVGLHSKSRKIFSSELKNIIEKNLEPSVIIIRDFETEELCETLFLPEAVDKNPYKRKLTYEIDIDKRLKYSK